MSCILGVESTCDETSVAIVENGRRVLSNVVASQAQLHAAYGGVVPEVASRAHIEALLPTLKAACDEALAGAGVGLDEVDAVAVANRPGLIGSLLVGVTAAKTLAWATGRKLVDTDHVLAHLYSVLLDNSVKMAFPAVGLVCSGGHTAVYFVQNWTQVVLLGRTIDDAVGEAYDKVAAILGLGYPGGPVIDRLAQKGDPRAIRFPRSLLGPDSLDFSFSGLKTSVLYHVRGEKGRERDASGLSEAQVADVAASFQAACVETLLTKLRRALDQTGAGSVIVGGGVSANAGLRAQLPGLGVPVFVPELRFCTDNAAMSAGLAHEMLAAGRVSDLSLEAVTTSGIPVGGPKAWG